MNLKIYPLLNIRSKRAITRYKKRNGQKYYYNPKQILIDNLSKKLGIAPIIIRQMIIDEREYLIKQLKESKPIPK